ncbi:MAG: GNAT family N-acetyltransferase, partial [Planctomycetota bacterium]
VLARIGALTFRQSYADVIPPQDLADYTAHAFSADLVRSELADPRIIYLSAVFSSETCAYSKLEPTPPPPQIKTAHPIELMRLYAMPECTGKGIGTKLMQASLTEALRSGYRSCWLRVWRGNTRAIKFYHNWGFGQVGHEAYFVGRASETVMLMSRSLENFEI